MNQNHSITSDLDKLVKRAAEAKQKTLEEAEKTAGDISGKLDSAEDGTSPATTGAQAASQISAQKESYPDPAADVGADDSKAGESVSMSTDGATAVSPTGQEGTQGGDLASGGVSEADNGPEDTDSPKNNGFNSGAFKSAAEQCRKMAAELRKQAQEQVSPFDQFLAKAARENDDEELKKQAEAMDDQALADAASDSLLEQIQSGTLGDEEATQILKEAIASGAVTAEELQEVSDNSEMGKFASDDLVQEKLAAAEIGPDHPDYLRKLAHFYSDDINSGYAFAMKLAEEMVEEVEEEEEETPTEEPEAGEAPETEEAPEAPAAAPEAAAAPADIPPAVVEEAAAEGEAPEQEMAEEMIAPAPTPAVAGPEGGEAAAAEMLGMAPASGDEGGAVSDESAVEGTIEDDLTPTTPEEEAALGAVGNELGLDEATLAQLLGAPLPPEQGAQMGKVASALKEAGVDHHSRYRTLLMQKVAALRQGQ